MTVDEYISDIKRLMKEEKYVSIILETERQAKNLRQNLYMKTRDLNWNFVVIDNELIVWKY